MIAPQKSITADIGRLKKHISFDYLEILELDDAERPTTFTEHPVPPKVAIPKNTGFWVLSARACMRWSSEGPSVVMRVPRTELAANWKHDVLMVLQKIEGMAILLVFHSRRQSVDKVDLAKISEAIKVN